MLIATLDHLQNLEAFREAGADGLIAGLQGFDSRSLLSLDLESLLNMAKKARQLGLKVFVNMQRPLYEENKIEAEKMLAALKDQVDGIYISDEGYLLIAEQLGMTGQMIFQSETLITSLMDASFYQDLGLQAVSLAHDLSLEEIQEILSGSEAKRLEILAHGHFAWMESARPLLSDYFSYIGIPALTSGKQFTIQEKSRQYAMKITEDDQGTVVYSPQPKSSYLQVPVLQNYGLERFRIDGLFLSPEELLEQISLYARILNQRTLDSARMSGSDLVYHQKMGLFKEKEV